MKNMILKTIIVGLSLIAFSACKPATKQGVRSYSAGTRTDIVPGNGTGTIFNTSCSNGQEVIGTIYDNSMNAYTFEQRVKSFLSASTSPDEVGFISSGPTDSTGVRFKTNIKLDASGNVIPQQSRLEISVYDSYVAGNNMQPIKVTITSAQSGQFNLQTGQGSVIFRDSYGDVRLEGQISGQYLQGTVSFANTVTVIPNSQPASGVLGSFYIQACGALIQ